NSAGFIFPPPEGLSLSYQPQLLVAQAFIPPTERVEVAGFVFPGDNFAIRDEVLRRLNAVDAYRKLFGQSFPEVNGGAPINFRARLAEKLSIRINCIEPSQHLIANSEVVSGKDKSGHLDAFRRWNERLSH